jgi:hypothetical protein
MRYEKREERERERQQHDEHSFFLGIMPFEKAPHGDIRYNMPLRRFRLGSAIRTLRGFGHPAIPPYFY